MRCAYYAPYTLQSTGRLCRSICQSRSMHGCAKGQSPDQPTCKEAAIASIWVCFLIALSFCATLHTCLLSRNGIAPCGARTDVTPHTDRSVTKLLNISYISLCSYGSAAMIMVFVKHHQVGWYGLNMQYALCHSAVHHRSTLKTRSGKPPTYAWIWIRPVRPLCSHARTGQSIGGRPMS